MPIPRRRSEKLRFQFLLSKAQFLFVGFDARQEPAQLGGLLRGHPAVLIEVDGSVRH